jgi:rhomboid family GlyGly-CTERM serine protease
MAVMMVTTSMPWTRKNPRSGRQPAGIQSPRTGTILLAGAAALFCLGGLFAEALMPLLRYDRPALAGHEWWRLVSAHLVHFDLQHGVLNAAALVLTAWIVGRRVAITEWLLLAVGSLIAVDAGLYWLSPDVGWYVGASGMLHGLFAGSALMLALRERDVMGGMMLLLLAAKLAYEHLSGGTSLFMDGAGFTVVTEAHLYGAVGGLATALGILAVRYRR